MAKREFLHKRTNRRIVKPTTAVKIAKVPDEASERASDQSLDIVCRILLVLGKTMMTFKLRNISLKPFQNTECCI